MGERRWRACELAGIDTVPAIVRHTQDQDLLRDALLENLHRTQLNALEEAAAYQQLLEDFQCTQEELSRRIANCRLSSSDVSPREDFRLAMRVRYWGCPIRRPWSA